MLPAMSCKLFIYPVTHRPCAHGDSLTAFGAQGASMYQDSSMIMMITCLR